MYTAGTGTGTRTGTGYDGYDHSGEHVQLLQEEEDGNYMLRYDTEEEYGRKGGSSRKWTSHAGNLNSDVEVYSSSTSSPRSSARGSNRNNRNTVVNRRERREGKPER